jgi:PAS domain S-box-containing protein
MTNNSSEPPARKADALDFLAGGGEMGALMRAHDWSSSTLGPPDRWPQSLRTVVRLMLNTGHPMYIWWGADGACLYNDAYRESIGPERHPGSLGRPAREVWDEIWDIIGPQIEQVMSGGGATWHEDHLVPITRHGRREDVYWTYSYSPIDDENAPQGIGGVLVICTETTKKVLAERRLAKEIERQRRVLQCAPGFIAIFNGPDHVFDFVNDAYIRLVGDRGFTGRTVRDVFPELQGQGFFELLDRVFATGERFIAEETRVQIVRAPGQPREDRFLNFVYEPMLDDAGKVTGIFVEGFDVTDRAQAHAALRESEARYRSALTAGQMGNWETDYVTGTRTWSQEGMALFGLDLPDGRGHVGGEADEYVRAMHPADRHLAQEFRELADTQDAFSAEYRIVRPDGTIRWVSGRGQVIERSPDGKARRLVSIMADVTDRKAAEDHIQFLMREISHRSKNLLSVVQAIASQTGRSAGTVDEFQARFSRRLQGLAASHDLLVHQNWQGATLSDLVRDQVAPFVEVGNMRLAVAGPDVFLRPEAAEALGLALHELATNAVKHGSLSAPTGRVTVSWILENEGAALRMSWVERGGPPATPPSHKGFGHVVFERIISRSLGGKVTMDFAPDGLSWDLTIALANIVPARKGLPASPAPQGAG